MTPVFRSHYNYKFAISSSRKKQSYVTAFFLGLQCKTLSQELWECFHYRGQGAPKPYPEMHLNTKSGHGEFTLPIKTYQLTGLLWNRMQQILWVPKFHLGASCGGKVSHINPQVYFILFFFRAQHCIRLLLEDSKRISGKEPCLQLREASPWGQKTGRHAAKGRRSQEPKARRLSFPGKGRKIDHLPSIGSQIRA